MAGEVSSAMEESENSLWSGSSGSYSGSGSSGSSGSYEGSRSYGGGSASEKS